ncbi:MAG: tail fiber protein [Psychroserpens sp.]|uniref:phage tail protein n=1 Tax=Psychroserpens sp. TaxID=2020870 RepID=UPI00300228B0
METFLGQILAFGFNFAPQGWAKCDGQLLQVSQNTALFSLLGTQYGGDGRTTFALPDLRGRSGVHVGNGPGLPTVQIGQKSGNTQINITTANMPNHNHDVKVAVNTGAGDDPTSTGIIASHVGGFSEDPTSGAILGGLTQNTVGSGQAISHRSPFLTINYCIALVGIYPSRS